MGDRTSVTLTVLADRAAEALFLIGEEPDYNHGEGKGFAVFEFSEVNYGNLQNLDKLKAHGIAFDSDWDSGSEYGPGTHWCRFTRDGSVRENEISNEYKNPPLEELMRRLDDTDALIGYITAYHLDVTPPAWDHQNEFGAIYRTKNLISS
jgi:hypothetical protein